VDIHLALPIENKIEIRSNKERKFQELVARFCYAAAPLPTETIVAAIELLETCAESDTIASTIGVKSKKMQ